MINFAVSDGLLFEVGVLTGIISRELKVFPFFSKKGVIKLLGYAWEMANSYVALKHSKKCSHGRGHASEGGDAEGLWSHHFIREKNF